VRRRFFVDAFDGERALMSGDAAHHLGGVLRAEAGQLYELSDGERVRLGRVERVGRDCVEFALLEEIAAYRPAVETTLLLSIMKFDAFEWALEKATELGVCTLVPLAAARSEKGLIAAAGKRAERWRKILLEASQQSRRVSAPALSDVRSAAEAFAAGGDRLRILLSERKEAPPLKKVLAVPLQKLVTLAIGPEGGWTDMEFDAARSAGFREASLGGLILRAETAVIAGLATLNYAMST
jgi:16S rRNA (uracil1498-N3)-methyltransferase